MTAHRPHWLVLIAVLWLGLAHAALAEDPVVQVRALPQASLLVKERGRDRIAYQAEVARIPASTLKLLTAYAALESWGRDHRFHTDLFQDASGWLWVKGYADPYLVSEELDRLVTAIKRQGVHRVAGIGLDDSLFDPDLEIAGRSTSSNPYDAPVTALAANFNTLNLIREGEHIHSAEPQTPLTATGERLGRLGPQGQQRINLRERALALRYFGELLAAKLRTAGIEVGDRQQLATTPGTAKRLLRYQNSRTLAEMVAPMLKYSNNFIANALFLRLAAPDGQGQIRPGQAQRALTDFARRRFGWTGFTIDDGAGLSRANRLSARQLVELLEAFAPYRDLMPQQDDDPNVRAKTGTLSGISSYAGYVRRGGVWEPFALLIEQPVAYDLRRQVASQLAR
ncbi:D-alanyl-D-alanine carboxypeptidase/D-alanyl-D-alanine-endopeptidase [Thermochromatium tepidum]|uniref:Peptidase S13 n=1 Tax=Thermochromatium tepidum ATCC 43061 TaxID=316276 RepID=A0A6I6E053_THETI|nr:D-alanyl-D-alanine carboxypeptidase [Thermochromatium tepidum]QGU32315.1 peptidase S13 [Thermochromatium tepidum ATCC 43061]